MEGSGHPGEVPLLTSAGLKSIPRPLLLPGNKENQPNCRGNPRYLERERAGNGNGIERGFGVRSLGDTNYQDQQCSFKVLVSALHYYLYDARDAPTCIPILLPA